jgi:hypothetical protein
MPVDFTKNHVVVKLDDHPKYFADGLRYIVACGTTRDSCLETMYMWMHRHGFDFPFGRMESLYDEIINEMREKCK